MSRKTLTSLLACLSVLAFAVMSVGSASGALMKVKEKTAFLAIYGSPPTTGPVGGGLGRNFGFGENMLFRAGNGVGKAPLAITINAEKLKARDSFIGLTLSSNTTGANNPLSVVVSFIDFQDSFVGETHVPTYADTVDRHSIGEICSPAAAVGKCKVDPSSGAAAGEGSEPGEVKLENVSFDVGPGVVIQGAAWGKWKQGEAKKAPCIELHMPPTKPEAVHTQTLYETQGTAVGAAITAISGEVCLISSQHWYSVPAEGTEPAEKEEPAIEIANE